jgi:hypothetical protein
MREQVALSLFRAEQAAKASAEAQLEAARQEIARLTKVAASGSQGEPGTNGLMPLPDAAATSETSALLRGLADVVDGKIRSLSDIDAERATVDALTREHAELKEEAPPHHCAPSDYTAMIGRLQQIEAGELPVRDVDWRTQAGVLWRMLHYATRCTDANVDAFLGEFAELSELRAQRDALTAALRAHRDELRTMAMVAGQSSVEGYPDEHAFADGRLAEYCTRWADTLDAVLLDERGSR